MPSLGPGTLSACSGRAVSMNVLPVVPLAKREAATAPACCGSS
jgi:hypothetical protein